MVAAGLPQYTSESENLPPTASCELRGFENRIPPMWGRGVGGSLSLLVFGVLTALHFFRCDERVARRVLRGAADSGG